MFSKSINYSSFRNYLFFFSIFSILFPPIIIFGLNSYVIGKFFIIIIFFSEYFLDQPTKFKKTDYLIILYFLFSILSILNSKDIYNSAKAFVDFITAIFLYFVLKKLDFTNKKKIINLILISFFLIHIARFLLIIFPKQTFNLLTFFVHYDYLKLVDYHIKNNKIYFFPWIDIFFCFYLYFVSKLSNSKYRNFLFIFFIFSFLIFFNIIFGGFRSALLIYFFSILYFLLIFLKGKVLKKIKIFFLILLICSFFLHFTKNFFNYLPTRSSFERLFLVDESDLYTINFRISQIKFILEDFPTTLFGIGFKNYLLYLDNFNIKLFKIVDKNQRDIFFISQNLHNVFLEKYVENGIFGLFIFVYLLIFFLLKDFKILLTKDIKKDEISNLKKLFIGSFWLLIIYSMFNPSNSDFNFNTLFFLSRGYIE